MLGTTSAEHCRAWIHWSKEDARTSRISATAFFKHEQHITNPTVTREDSIAASATNLSDVLQNNMQAQCLGKTKLEDQACSKLLASKLNNNEQILCLIIIIGEDVTASPLFLKQPNCLTLFLLQNCQMTETSSRLYG
jgi:hypothetical protein